MKKDSLWLVKMEEDFPLDDDPFPHRSHLMGDFLSAHYQVLRFMSNYNHKAQKFRDVPTSKLTEYKSDYTFWFLPALAYRSNKIKRIISMYLSAFFLFVAMYKNRHLAPSSIIVSVPQPINLAITCLFKKMFLSKTKVYVDYRDLWPDILYEEADGLFTKLLVNIMRLELKFSSKQVNGTIGITDFFSSFLFENYSFPDKRMTYYLAKPSQASEKPTLGKQCSIIFGGTLSKATVSVLLKFVDLVREEKSIVLHICGTGYYEKTISEIKQENVHFHGHLSFSKYNDLRKTCAFGLILVESRVDYLNSLSNKFFDLCSCGMPIITFPCGLTSQMVEENGLGIVLSAQDNLTELLENKQKYNSYLENINAFNKQVINLDKNNEALLAFLKAI